MNNYKCPKCSRNGMGWDARAKVLMCYFRSCSHVIHIQDYDRIPTPVIIEEAIGYSQRQGIDK